MPFKAAVFSPDRLASVAFAEATADLPVDLILLSETGEALECIQNERVDLLVVDCDSADGKTVLEQVRASNASRSAIVFGVCADFADARLIQMGANLLVRRPIDRSVLAHRVREALPLMQEERRRYRRYPVNFDVQIEHAGNNVSATALNLSEGGMTVQMTQKLETLEVVTAGFTLPATGQQMRVQAKLAWITGDSLAGLRFVMMTAEQRSRLSEWASTAHIEAEVEAEEAE